LGVNEFRKIDPVQSPVLNPFYARRTVSAVGRVGRARAPFDARLKRDGRTLRGDMPEGPPLAKASSRRPKTCPDDDPLGGRVDVIA